jgi:hypothetical protein
VPPAELQVLVLGAGKLELEAAGLAGVVGSAFTYEATFSTASRKSSSVSLL